jgi:hypothetical protein
MRIYLDEDLASGLLAKLLQKAGHDVATPTGAGTLGRSDAVQLACAIRERRACLSRNYEDFEELHLLIAESQGHHPGILIVRRETIQRATSHPRASWLRFANWKQPAFLSTMSTWF